MSEKATIIVKNETRDLMKKIGRKDQTYDDLILELIQFKQKQGENKIENE